MADNEIKIKVIVDDSQEKKYYSESESRRKKSTAQETQEEIRKTAILKEQLNERYAKVKQALALELEAEKHGNRLEIKEAIAKRKILESELRTFEAFNRNSLSRQLADFKAAKQMELVEARKSLSDFRNAPKTKLRGAIGSEAYVSQLIAAQKTMQVGSSEFNQTGALIERYQTSLKGANREVKSLSQQIGGELNNSLKSNVNSLLSSSAAYLGLGIAMSKVTQFASESVQAFMKQETALRSLSFAIEKVRGGNKLYTEELITFAEEQQDLVGINDDTIEQAQTYLVLQGRTNDQIKELVKTAIDLSAVQGDLSDENVIANIQKLDATYEGVTGKLGKYDSRIKDLTQTQLENGDAVKLLGEKFKGTAEEVNKGTEGAWRKWVVGLSEAKEVAGGVIVTLLTLNQSLSDIFDEALNAQKGLQNFLGELIGLRREAQTPIKVTIDVEAPNLNNVWSQIQGLRQGTITDQLRTASWVTGKSWEEIMKIAQDKGWVGFAKELEAMGSNTSNNSGSNNSGSKTETQKEELNLLKLAETELAKQNERLNANLDSEIARLEILQNIAELEAKITFYKGNQAYRGIMTGAKDFASSGRFLRNNRVPVGEGGLVNPRQQDIEDMERQEALNIAMLNGFEGMNNFVASMLEKTGLMNSDFGQIVQMIQQLIGVGKEAFSVGSLIGDIISLFPGGSTIGGLSGGGGGGLNPLAGGMPSGGGMSFRPVIRIEGELSKFGTYRIVSEGNNYIAERGDGVY